VVAVVQTQETPAAVQSQKVAAVAEDMLDFGLVQTMVGLEEHNLELGTSVAGAYYQLMAGCSQGALPPGKYLALCPNHSGPGHSPLQLKVEHDHNSYKNVHCPVDLPRKTYSAAWLFLRVENMWLYSIQIPVKKQDRILQYITEENLKQ
jgi:hypothetical protein